MAEASVTLCGMTLAADGGTLTRSGDRITQVKCPHVLGPRDRMAFGKVFLDRVHKSRLHLPKMVQNI